MALLKSMRQEAIAATHLGLYETMVWQEVSDVVIEVYADAISIEYVAKCGDEIRTTEDINEFNELLVAHFN